MREIGYAIVSMYLLVEVNYFVELGATRIPTS